MKFTIQEEGKGKQVFLTFKKAEIATGISSSNILKVLKRQNKKFKRKYDGKVFLIQEEKDEKLCSIDGEDFFSFGEIKNRFGISPTVFLNQISRKKKHFLDKDEISHFVKDFSPEMEKLCDLQKIRFVDENIVKLRGNHHTLKKKKCFSL